MIRWLAAAMIWVLASNVQAQSQSPLVTAELSADTVVVGQPLILRVTVLVPTWMPQPPSFPSMEAPNLMVRLPERSTGPVSQSIDGETWSGVSRAYRLYPMIGGSFQLPAASVSLTYADPETTDPIKVDVALDAVTFVAEVPESAQGLDPLILAEAFKLEQVLDAGEGDLKQGDAVSRTITATISGTTALFIPPLIPEIQTSALRAYPKDPVVSDSENRGVLSGSRTDTVSYIAQSGGTVELDPVSVDWFNVKTNTVETAQLDGATIKVDAPLIGMTTKLSPLLIAKICGLGAVFALISWGFWRFFLPLFASLQARRKSAREASEAFAAQQVFDAIKGQDIGAVHNAIALWSARCSGVPSLDLSTAMAKVGNGLYGPDDAQNAPWDQLKAAFKTERNDRLAANASTIGALPPLNPN